MSGWDGSALRNVSGQLRKAASSTHCTQFKKRGAAQSPPTGPALLASGAPLPPGPSWELRVLKAPTSRPAPRQVHGGLAEQAGARSSEPDVMNSCTPPTELWDPAPNKGPLFPLGHTGPTGVSPGRWLKPRE